MAKVRVNQEEFPVSWLPPHVIDITKAAKAGKNTLVVAVVNLWPNRLIGDEHLPPDSAAERDPKNGRLHTWPKWVLDGKPSPTGRQSFVTFPLWKKSDPLQPSGLLGPVQLVFPDLPPPHATPQIHSSRRRQFWHRPGHPGQPENRRP